MKLTMRKRNIEKDTDEVVSTMETVSDGTARMLISYDSYGHLTIIFFDNASTNSTEVYLSVSESNELAKFIRRAIP